MKTLLIYIILLLLFINCKPHHQGVIYFSDNRKISCDNLSICYDTIEYYYSIATTRSICGNDIEVYYENSVRYISFSKVKEILFLNAGKGSRYYVNTVTDKTVSFDVHEYYLRADVYDDLTGDNHFKEFKITELDSISNSYKLVIKKIVFN